MTIKKKSADQQKTTKKPVVKKAAKKAVKKTTKLKKTKKAKQAVEENKTRRYFEAVGRRKKAVARVRLFSCSPFEGDGGQIIINEKPYTKFFHTLELQGIAEAALKKMKSLNRFKVTVKVKGGGIRGQAEAIRHGLARTLVEFNADFRKKLKRAGYLRRDPRMKERKKPGLKKARKAPQWKKR